MTADFVSTTFVEMKQCFLTFFYDYLINLSPSLTKTCIITITQNTNVVVWFRITFETLTSKSAALTDIKQTHILPLYIHD